MAASGTSESPLRAIAWVTGGALFGAWCAMQGGVHLGIGALAGGVLGLFAGLAEDYR